jgi:hypothetical protein
VLARIRLDDGCNPIHDEQHQHRFECVTIRGR